MWGADHPISTCPPGFEKQCPSGQQAARWQIGLWLRTDCAPLLSQHWRGRSRLLFKVMVVFRIPSFALALIALFALAAPVRSQDDPRPRVDAFATALVARIAADWQSDPSQLRMSLAADPVVLNAAIWDGTDGRVFPAEGTFGHVSFDLSRDDFAAFDRMYEEISYLIGRAIAERMQSVPL